MANTPPMATYSDWLNANTAGYNRWYAGQVGPNGKPYGTDLTSGTKDDFLPRSKSSSSSSSSSGIFSGGNTDLYHDPNIKVDFNPNDLSSLFTGQRESSVQQLQADHTRVLRQQAIKKALADYDSLYASTKATGFQAANNAGTVYANRLMQSGVNPTASGVVTAQAKLPVYSALAAINQQKSATRLDAIQKADALAAQIASTIANIQLNYSKTLADYNTSLNAQHLNAGEFNASQTLQAGTSDRDYSLKLRSLQDQEKAQAAAQAAQLASRGGGSGGLASPIAAPFDPGYITSFGPIRGGRGVTPSGAILNDQTAWLGLPPNAG